MSPRSYRYRPPLPLLVGLALLSLAVPSRAQALNAGSSWLGNSLPGTPNSAHVQDDIQALSVAPDGTCYTNSTYDEGHQDCGIYKRGRLVGSCGDLGGFGRGGGTAITADASYVYLTMTQSGDDGANANLNANGLAQYPPANHVWYCVRRYTLAGVPAPFPAGYGPDGSMLIVNTGVRPQPNTPYSGADLSGLAVDGDSLYVSDPAADQIKQYSLATLAATPTHAWSLPRPGPLVVGLDSLFVIQGGTIPKILRYGLSGSLLATLTFVKGVVPAALAYSPTTRTLLVADQGPDQDIKKYRLSGLTGTPTRVAGTFGVTGGVFAGTGATIGTAGPLRFNNPSGVGVDGSGNIYVAQDTEADAEGNGGGSILEGYAPSGARNWQLLGLEFLDCADADLSSGADVFTKKEHFVMDYARTTPGTEAAYVGYTINRFKYPQDPRAHFGLVHEAGTWVREYRGHRFLVSTDQYAQSLVISRFSPATDGQCAVPSTVFTKSHDTPDSSGWPENQPKSGEWIWRDASGDGAFQAGEYTQPVGGGDAPGTWGWWADSNMDVWQATQTAGIRHFACQGLDAHGNPVYDYAHMTTTPMPSQFNDLERIEYDPATDTMYLTGYSASQPNPNNDWGLTGTVVCRYDHWNSAPALHTGYPVVLPFSDSLSTLPKSVSVAGRYIFVGYVLKNPSNNAWQNLVAVYAADTGAQVGTLYPGAAIGGTGAADTNIGANVIGNFDFPYSVCAYERANGEYLVFLEDDLLGKVVMYRWTPQRQARDLRTPNRNGLLAGSFPNLALSPLPSK